MFQNKSNQDGKQVSGLIIDGRVMTTDELYRAHQEQNKEISDVPDPFVRSSTNNQAIETISDENDLQIGEEEGADAWKGWDEGWVELGVFIAHLGFYSPLHYTTLGW